MPPGLTEPCVARLTKELAAEQNGRLPPEARADLAMTQVRLTRRSVPDEDPEQTLLLWLARRGFHDVLTLRADAGFEVFSNAGQAWGHIPVEVTNANLHAELLHSGTEHVVVAIL